MTTSLALDIAILVAVWAHTIAAATAITRGTFVYNVMVPAWLGAAVTVTLYFCYMVATME